MKSVVVALSALFSFVAPCVVYAFDWNGATQGAIEINEPVTVSTDEDAAKMAALKSITIAEGGSISCVGLNSEFNISANFSGSGSFSATNCKKIILSGDNSAFLGGFSFSGTSLTVGSRYGLGGSGTAPCRFDYGENVAQFDFDFGDDVVVMTNDVPIEVETFERTKPSFGPADNSKTLVLLGGWALKEGGGSHYIRFRGKSIVFDGGEFGSRNGHLYTECDGAPELWFMERTYINIAGGYWFALASDTYHFMCNYTKLQCYAPISSHVTVCEKEDAFPSTMTLSMYLGQPKEDVGFNLNGFDQTINILKAQDTISAGKFLRVMSSSEATLTLSGNSTGEQIIPCKMTGKVNLHYNNAYTLTFTNEVSTTEGYLKVSKGAVKFARGSGWSGADIFVEGGVLVLDSSSAFSTARQKLIVSDAGKLKVTSAVGNTGAYFADVTIGGVVLEKDTIYTVAELKEMDGVGAYIDAGSDDDAKVVIAAESVEWNGWPEEGGEVVVPVGKTVEIADADVAKVQRVSKLKLSPDSVVKCRNTSVPLVLSAAVSGSGIIDIQSPAGVTLAGDSSLLDAPGCYIAHDTVVTVTHRYGLGDAGTGEFQSLGGDIIFKGNGLTNDVAVYYTTGPNGRMFGPRDCRGPWVQNGNFIGDKAVSGQYTLFTNDVVFADSCQYGTKGGGVLFYQLLNDAKFEALPGTSMYYPGGGIGIYFLARVAGVSSYSFAGKAIAGVGIGTANLSPNATWCHLKGEDIFAALANGVNLYGSVAPMCAVDLNGYDQRMAQMRIREVMDKGSSEVTELKKYARIHSEKPATLTFTKPSAGEIVSGLRFTGAVNFTYAAQNDDPYKLYWQKSTSTGALTVESGNLHFVNDNSWGGTNIFLKGGSLVVSSIQTNPFSAVTQTGRANADLFVSGDAVLELGADVTAAVRCLQVNGEWLRRGEYTASAKNPWLKGLGKLHVRKDSPKPGVCLIFR